MKKEIQALLHRRRSRVVPAIFAGLAVLIVAACLLLIVSYFVGGPVAILFRTPTPTPSPTPPATATSSDTPTLLFTDTPTVTPGPSPTPAPITYTVKEGDTLYGIALEFKVDLCELMAANQIANPSLIAVGQTLTIPLGGFEPPTPTPLPTGLAPGSRITYVVRCGDTLQSIAAQFGSTAEDIATRNNITDPNTIGPGDVLIVRINIATPTPSPTSTVSPRATDTPTPSGTP